MPSLRAVALVVLLLLAVVHASKPDSAVEMSLDNGRTWIPAIASGADISTASTERTALFRVRNSESFISLPICAATGGPAAVVWTALGALGVQSHRMCSGDKSFETLYAGVSEVRPKWHYYMHAPDASAVADKAVRGGKRNGDKKGEKSDEKKEKRGFWRKYGIFIALFVGISLFQGIREGNAQYLQELENEKRLEDARKAGTGNVTNIVVPRRKSSKEKRRKAAGATGGKTK